MCSAPQETQNNELAPSPSESQSRVPALRLDMDKALSYVKMTGQSWGLLYTNPVLRLSSLANLVVSLTDRRAGHAGDDPFEDERGETSFV